MKCWRRLVRSRLVIIAASLLFLGGLACQKAATPPDFVKYKDEGSVPRVSVQDAKAELDAGTAILVDARPADAYNQEHVAGAINIPLGTPADKLQQAVSSAQGKKIFIYCS
jgi:3-mercaptopyruvate sulfurtransferase SseA